MIPSWRQRLLGRILLVSLGVFALGVTANIVLDLMDARRTSTRNWLALLVLPFLVLLYWANRRGHAWPGTVYVLMFLGVASVVQPPNESFSGGNILALSLSLVASTFLITPYAAFVMALIVIADLFLLSFLAGAGYWGVYPSPNTLVTVVITALLSWAGAMATQRALQQAERANRALENEVAERKRAQQTLHEGQELLTMITDGLPALITYINHDLRYLYVNKAYADWYGFSKDEIIDKTVAEIIDPEAYQRALPYYQAALQGKRVSFENVARDKTHLQRAVQVDLMPHYDEQGQVKAFLGLVLDITEQRRAEETRRELEEKLGHAQRMEAIGTLAGGVAHDLNNILGPLVAYPDLILSELPADTSVREDVLQIQHSAERAAAIVQDLLTLARRGVYQMSPLDLNFVVRDYVHSPPFYELTLSNPNVTVDVDLAEDILPIVGSMPHLSKVLLNLVANAFDAMPYGGRLVIRTFCHSLDRDVMGMEPIPTGDYIVLQVQDNGVGIKQDDLDRVFEPFYTTKQMGRSGTGLGLAIVYGVVRDHSGKIDMHTQAGQGTTFTLYFPVSQAQVVVSQEESWRYGGDERILVVDDVESQRRMASRMLSLLGYQVVTVESGYAAVAYLREHEVDVLLLDMIMDEGFDGLDTYREVIKLRPGQKAVITSGFTETERVKEAQSLGAGPYVKKPYTMHKIAHAIRAVLDD